MFGRLFIILVLDVTIIITTGRATTLAFQATYRLPCMIFYPGEPPISTSCVAHITASTNSWVDIVKTGNGRSFIVEEDSTAHFYLDHEPCDQVSDERNPCYQNREVKLCFLDRANV
jgi:hypothetical protein